MFYEISTWCMRSNCSISTIGTSLTKNIFALTGTLNEIMQIAVEMRQSGQTNFGDLDNAYTTWQELGKNIGKIIRAILQFTPTSSYPVQPKSPSLNSLFGI